MSGRSQSERSPEAGLPDGAVKSGETRTMTERDVAPGLLRRHLAPAGKYGLLVVERGALDFVWEDGEGAVLTAVPDRPVVIPPRRHHHVRITGPVAFRVEFYDVPGTDEG